jgi:hypothetical protein
VRSARPRAAALSLATLAFAAASIGSSAAAGSAETGAEAKGSPTRMLVSASEFGDVHSRAKLPPGPALIELYNGGEDPHNLRIKRQGRKRVWRVPRLEPGGVGEVELRLRRGRRYVLWCSLPAHRERGMEAKLRARRRA